MIHRHVDVPPDTPVEEMPLAAIHDLLDRGDLDDWRPLLRQIERCRDRCDPRALDDRETCSLAGLRRSLGRTQEEVAGAMGISQSDYSKLERRRDLRVSTLRSAAGALGGSIHLTVRLPDRTVETVLGDAD